jgi:3'(2'), 5'-bisphosphate nucleotidase
VAMDLQKLLTIAIGAAEAAAEAILEVYHSGSFQAEVKDDLSPLTLADKQAHEKIAAALAVTSLPILSEEGKQIAYNERRHWEYFWMVDPLDGTKEFLKRNGEFTVNIALIHKGIPVLGVVAIPVTGEVFFAATGQGAWLKRQGQVAPLPAYKAASLEATGLRVVASRSHMNDETSAFINKLKAPVLVSKGSSLKFLLLAEGKADLYPRYAPTMEWDTAAAHAILRELGAKVVQWGRDEELRYNKEDLLNPYFLAM